MAAKSKNHIREFFRTFFGRGFIVKLCIGIILLMVLAAVFAPVLTSYSPEKISLTEKFQSPSAAHIFGTDHLGRDVLTRLLYGARISLVCSVLSCLIALAAGLFFGLIAGYYRGFASRLIMRVTDAQLSIPPLILTMVLASLMGGGVSGVSIVIGISVVPTYVRMVNSLVISLRESDYVTAAWLVGQNGFRILWRHILPNCVPSLIVLFTMNLGTAIMLEASMSFLGVGIAAPTPSWGGMVSDGYSCLISNPLLALLPGICVMLTVVAFNIVGDALRDALDPRLRGKL